MTADNSNRYGIIFDADVQIQDVTLADSEAAFDQVAADLQAQSEPLALAAQEAGTLAGARLGHAIRSEMVHTLEAQGGIHLKIAGALDSQFAKAVSRMDLSNLKVETHLDSAKLVSDLQHVIAEVGTLGGAQLGTKLAPASAAP